MQSRRIMKKVQDYSIGEHVRDCGHDVGKVVAIVLHPTKTSVAYLLLVTSRNEYTMYRGMTDCKGALTLARNIPEPVAMMFAEVILGGEAPPPPERTPKKYPVVAQPEEPAKTPVTTAASLSQATKAPYFDFV